MYLPPPIPKPSNFPLKDHLKKMRWDLIQTSSIARDDTLLQSNLQKHKHFLSLLWNWNVKVSIWRYFETEKGFLEDDSLTRENKDFWMEMNYNPSLFLLLQITHSASLKSTWWKKKKILASYFLQMLASPIALKAVRISPTMLILKGI